MSTIEQALDALERHPLAFRWAWSPVYAALAAVLIIRCAWFLLCVGVKQFLGFRR